MVSWSPRLTPAGPKTLSATIRPRGPVIVSGDLPVPDRDATVDVPAPRLTASTSVAPPTWMLLDGDLTVPGPKDWPKIPSPRR